MDARCKAFGLSVPPKRDSNEGDVVLPNKYVGPFLVLLPFCMLFVSLHPFSAVAQNRCPSHKLVYNAADLDTHKLI